MQTTAIMPGLKTVVRRVKDDDETVEYTVQQVTLEMETEKLSDEDLSFLARSTTLALDIELNPATWASARPESKKQMKLAAS